MMDGLGSVVLPIALIRRFIRLISAYYIAYSDGKDLITTDAWILDVPIAATIDDGEDDEDNDELYEGRIQDEEANDDDEEFWDNVVEDFPTFQKNM
jgi:hypothetical protein